MHEFLTFHTLTPLPWHNLNRDENGLPKQLRQGDSQRGLLSSQSLKRAARIRFEAGEVERSTRSKATVAAAFDEARRRADARGLPFADEATAKKVEQRIDAALSGGDTLLFLAHSEYEQLVELLAAGAGQPAEADELDGWLPNGRTGSLSIAAFGRMFANAKRKNTDAAIAVGPATTTHPIQVEIDFFTAVDDRKRDEGESAGSAHLGQHYFTSGVYARSFTIDRRQLHRSWTGFESASAADELAALFESLLLALPSGQRNQTAAQTLPAVIVAETQSYRATYDFQDPVRPGRDGGYLATSGAALGERIARVDAFDPDLVGERWIAGTDAQLLPSDVRGDRLGTLRELVELAALWTAQR